MKNREFLETVISGNLTDEAIEYARTSLEKLDAANAKRRGTPTKAILEKREANAVLTEKIYGVLSENPLIVADIIAAIGVEITPQKANYIARQLVDEGKVEAVTVKVPTKGSQRAYKLKA